MENGVPLMAGRFSSLHATIYFHGVAYIGERLYVDDR